MPKYIVSGTCSISVSLVVEADSEEEAKKKAYDEWPGLSSYCGNGRGRGALIGTSDRALTISADDAQPTFTEVALDE